MLTKDNTTMILHIGGKLLTIRCLMLKPEDGPSTRRCSSVRDRDEPRRSIVVVVAATANNWYWGTPTLLMTYNIISFYIAKNKPYIRFRSSEIHKFMARLISGQCVCDCGHQAASSSGKHHTASSMSYGRAALHGGGGIVVVAYTNEDWSRWVRAMSIHVRDGHIIAVSFSRMRYTAAYINKIWSAQIFSWHFVFATNFPVLVA